MGFGDEQKSLKSDLKSELSHPCTTQLETSSPPPPPPPPPTSSTNFSVLHLFRHVVGVDDARH